MTVQQKTFKRSRLVQALLLIAASTTYAHAATTTMLGNSPVEPAGFRTGLVSGISALYGVSTDIAGTWIPAGALAQPNTAASGASAISNTGLVVGSGSPVGTQKAQVWDLGAGTTAQLQSVAADATMTYDPNTYSISLTPTTTTSAALAVNNNGAMAGVSQDVNGVNMAVVWGNATVAPTVITQGSAFGINDAGVVVGQSTVGGSSSGFIYSNGALTAVNAGGMSSALYGINNSGIAVGAESANSSLSGSTAITVDVNGVTSPISLTSLKSFTGGTAFATAINDKGTIVGGYSTSTGEGAFVKTSAGVSALVGAGDNVNATINAVSSTDMLVGQAQLGSRQVAEVWTGTSYVGTDLNTLLDAGTKAAGWVLTSATGVDSNGDIIGTASNTQTGATSAFVMQGVQVAATPVYDVTSVTSPVPELSTWMALFAGLGLLGFLARRRDLGLSLPSNLA